MPAKHPAGLMPERYSRHCCPVCSVPVPTLPPSFRQTHRPTSSCTLASSICQASSRSAHVRQAAPAVDAAAVAILCWIPLHLSSLLLPKAEQLFLLCAAGGIAYTVHDCWLKCGKPRRSAAAVCCGSSSCQKQGRSLVTALSLSDN